MKTVLNTLYSIAVSIGQARAATALARAGHHEAARAIMLSTK